MHAVTGAPERALRGRFGSATMARVMPTASHAPEAIRRSASTGSSTRPVAITGAAETAFTRRANASTTFRAVDAGGTMKVDPR